MCWTIKMKYPFILVQFWSSFERLLCMYLDKTLKWFYGCRYGWDDQYYEYDESGEGWHQDAQGEWHQEPPTINQSFKSNHVQSLTLCWYKKLVGSFQKSKGCQYRPNYLSLVLHLSFAHFSRFGFCWQMYKEGLYISIPDLMLFNLLFIMVL